MTKKVKGVCSAQYLPSASDVRLDDEGGLIVLSGSIFQEVITLSRQMKKATQTAS